MVLLLVETNLSNTNFDNAVLNKVSLVRANLAGANLLYLSTILPDDINHHFNRPKLKGAIMPDGTIYQEDK